MMKEIDNYNPVSLRLPASLITLSRERVEATLVEISQLGAVVSISSADIETGGRLKLRGSLPVDQDSYEFICDVEVSHIYPHNNDGQYANLTFIDMKERTKERLHVFLSQALNRNNQKP